VKSVRARLLVGFGVVVLVLLLPSLFAADRLAQLRHLAVEGRSEQAAAVAGLGRIEASLAELDRLERSLVATSDSALARLADAAADSLRSAFGELSRSPYSEQAERLRPHVAAIDSLSRTIGVQVRTGRITEATATLAGMIPRFADVEAAASEVTEAIDAQARQDFLHAEELSASARVRTLAGLMIALIVAALVVLVTTGALTRPLRRLSRATARVADGRFETPEALPYQRSDEIGDLSRSFRTMTRRLEQLDRSKAEFLGMATHELKTPLNVIAAYAELIGEELGDDASERHRGMVAGVAEQARIMSRLVSRLMDISRLEAGTYRLAPEPVRVEDLVTGIEALVDRVAKDRDVVLRIRIAETAPESVTLDVDIVRDEVFGNLLSNALRFTPPGGWIEIEAEGMPGGIAFTVTDSGTGIAEEHRSFIFDKHYTVDRARAVGSGLGLAIAKEMVELHGGMITLEESEADHGARFRVAFPLSPATDGLEVPGYAVPSARSPRSPDARRRPRPRRPRGSKRPGGIGPRSLS
jgi:signal transduction histidine kinase